MIRLGFRLFKLLLGFIFFSIVIRPLELFSENISHEKERCKTQLHTTLTLALALNFVVGSTFLVEELEL